MEGWSGRGSLGGAGSFARAGGGNLEASSEPGARPLRAARPAGYPSPAIRALRPLVVLEIEEISRFHGLLREAAACGGDGRDAAPGRFHPPHPDPKQVLAAVTGLSREVSRLDPSTLDEAFQSSGHVQYHAQYREA